MNGIDPGVYEAAIIDGAGFFQTLWRVTVPSIRFAIEFWVVFNFIEVFARMFSLIYTLTRGGPGYGTFTLEYGIFVQGFEKFRVGYSSAWSVVLFIFCAVISVAADPPDAAERVMKKASSIGAGTRVLVQRVPDRAGRRLAPPAVQRDRRQLQVRGRVRGEPLPSPEVPHRRQLRVRRRQRASAEATRSTASSSFPAAWCCTWRCASRRAMRSARCGSA